MGLLTPAEYEQQLREWKKDNHHTIPKKYRSKRRPGIETDKKAKSTVMKILWDEKLTDEQKVDLIETKIRSTLFYHFFNTPSTYDLHEKIWEKYYRYAKWYVENKKESGCKSWTN